MADVAYEGDFPVKVIDVSTKEEVANQLITKENKKYVRIWATNLPSVGYKVYEIQKGSPKNFSNQLSASGDQISNQFYKIKISPSGAITEIFNRKDHNKQLVLNEKTLNNLGVKNL